MAGVSTVATLDPARAIDPASIAVCSLLYEGLVTLSPQGSIQPAAASSWHVSNGGRRYIFTLRHGLRFSNGTRLTAAKVVQSFERDLSMTGGGSGITGLSSDLLYRSGRPRVFATKRGQVEFVLARPKSQFLAQLTGTLTYVGTNIVDPQTVHRYGTVWTLHADGLGPYRLKSWVPGKKLVLAPNRYYQGVKPAQTLVITFSTQPREVLAGFRSGTPSLVTGLEPSQVHAPRPQTDERVVTLPNLDFAIVNTTRPPFNRLSFRQALSLDVNRANFAKTIYGLDAVPTAWPVPASLLSEKTTQPQMPPPSSGFRIHASRHPVLIFQNTTLETKKAHLLAQMWAARAGVAFKLVPLSFSSYLTRLQSGDFNVATASWGARYPDATDFLDQLLRDDSLNFARWTNAQFESAMAAAQTARADSTARMRDLRNAVAVLDHAIPWIPLDNPVQVVLVQPWLTTIEATPFGLSFTSGCPSPPAPCNP